MAAMHGPTDPPAGGPPAPDSAEYDLMLQLEQLESLKEEMEELGVRTLAEIEARIAELNARLDGLSERE